jgi:hypothetical protein
MYLRPGGGGWVCSFTPEMAMLTGAAATGREFSGSVTPEGLVEGVVLAGPVEPPFTEASSATTMAATAATPAPRRVCHCTSPCCPLSPWVLGRPFLGCFFRVRVPMFPVWHHCELRRISELHRPGKSRLSNRRTAVGPTRYNNQGCSHTSLTDWRGDTGFGWTG